MTDPPHYHWVQKPGEEKAKAQCSLPNTRCPFADATPEQIGRWLEMGFLVIPFADWLKGDNNGVWLRQEVESLQSDNVVYLPNVRKDVWGAE